jgi:ferredoxin--NADP+ reductase
MYNSSLSGNTSSSLANSRLFVYEIVGLRDNQSVDASTEKVRTSGSKFITVPYQRMSQEMRRIARLGGKILSIRPLGTGEAIQVPGEQPAPVMAVSSEKTCRCPSKYLSPQCTLCW